MVARTQGESVVDRHGRHPVVEPGGSFPLAGMVCRGTAEFVFLCLRFLRGASGAEAQVDKLHFRMGHTVAEAVVVESVELADQFLPR